MTDTADREAFDPSTSPQSGVASVSRGDDSGARHLGSVPRRPLLRRRGVVIGASVLAGVLVLGGGTFAAVKLITRGASSPEAAAQRLIDGTIGGDVLALAGTFAPSEATYLQPLVEQASKIQPRAVDEDGVDYVALLSRLKDSATVTLDDLEFETEEVTEGVQVVSLVDGTVTIDGDPERIASALTDIMFAGPATGEYYGDIEQRMSEQQNRMREQLADELPITWDIGEFTDGIRAQYSESFEPQTPLSVVVVDEGGWYVSPMLTAADQHFSQVLEPNSMHSDRLPVERGEEIVEAAPEESPEDALQALADGVSEAFATGDTEALAAALPLPERRMISLYGEAMFADAAYWSSQGQDRRLDFPRLDVKSEEIDGGVQLTVKRIDVEYLLLREASGSVQFTRECVLPEWGSRFCLGDNPVLGRLGIESFHAVATEENGGWVINPLATFARQGKTVLGKYAEYVREDKLDKLFRID